MTPICINFSSFLDESICSVPDLEELPNPDLTEIPSFQDKIIKQEIVFGSLGYTKNLCPLLIQCKYAIINLSKDHPLIPYSSIN